MLSRMRNMFRVPDLRNKILFTLAAVGIYRVGCFLPVPYVDFGAIKELQHQASQDGGTLGYLNLFAGGALTNVAILFLGPLPYITASIIMQLLGVVIPKIEEWQQEGQAGQKKITQWTRYMTIGLGIIQSTAFVFALKNGTGGPGGLFNFGNTNPLPNFTPWRGVLIIITWTAGTAFVMWLGELITQRGIGQGISIIMFASVVSGFPGSFTNVYQNGGWFKLAIAVAIVIGTVYAITFVESGQRRIPVQFAKRVVGRRMYGGQSTYIPLKVNQSGVIPVIFASSILSFPALLTNVTPDSWGLQKFVNDHLTNQFAWFYIITYTLLIIAFSYFYTAIAFNPQQQADIIRKQGGFIPGIRPGPPTERYLARLLNRITFPGSLFLAFIAVLPLLIFKFGNIQGFAFGGMSILIAVGVMLETMKQIDSQLMMRNYEGFLK